MWPERENSSKSANVVHYKYSRSMLCNTHTYLHSAVRGGANLQAPLLKCSTITAQRRGKD